jgi:tRNA (cmo5U34)-methyltransferase
MEQYNKFDFNTIQDFDEHITKSIPNYDILISSIKSISEYFFAKDTTVYDLGCSTGKLLMSLDTKCKKVGYDNAALMPDEYGLHHADLNADFEVKNACVVYSIFTMQFLNPEARQKYLDTIYRGLNKGGALILCEKIYQTQGRVQEILAFSHYDYKLKVFSEKEIIAKERDLRYIMKPNTLNELEQMIGYAGFETATTFWQMFNFKGILCIK